MIYAELAGGLGNQMFIYAFARALGLRCGEGVTLLDRQDRCARPHGLRAGGTEHQPRGTDFGRLRLCQGASAPAERRQGADDKV